MPRAGFYVTRFAWPTQKSMEDAGRAAARAFRCGAVVINGGRKRDSVFEGILAAHCHVRRRVF